MENREGQQLGNYHLVRLIGQGTPLPLALVFSYVKQIADALQYAHDKRLIHRDVKPENMLVGQNDEILLSDFGLVLIAQSSGSRSTKEIAGTVPYMAPEQIQGRPRTASDQYALGIIVSVSQESTSAAARPGKTRWMLAVALVLLVLLLIFGSIAYALSRGSSVFAGLPFSRGNGPANAGATFNGSGSLVYASSAIVTITPKSKDVQNTYTIAAVTGSPNTSATG